MKLVGHKGITSVISKNTTAIGLLVVELKLKNTELLVDIVSDR